jgi:hypothetical protein
MAWQGRFILIVGGLFMLFAATMQLKSGHFVFTDGIYHQQTFASAGYAIGGLVILVALLPTGDWVNRMISTKRDRKRKHPRR